LIDGGDGVIATTGRGRVEAGGWGSSSSRAEVAGSGGGWGSSSRAEIAGSGGGSGSGSGI